MPVTENGRWESWETRRAREAAAEAAAEVVVEPAPEEAPAKPKRQRRSRAAAEAAIAEATGADVTITEGSEIDQWFRALNDERIEWKP